jgi:hypothetical protein
MINRILYLPSHVPQALQPLNCSFFKLIKTHYNPEAIIWINHKERYIMWYPSKTAFGKAAFVLNGSSGFKVTVKIFPLNQNVIPDCFFSIAENSVTPRVKTEPPDLRLDQVRLPAEFKY